MVYADGNRPSKKDFTGSFDAGKGTDISTYLIEHEHAQMILPVAGPQTGDVAGVIASTGNKGNVFVFGVDVDQSKVYNADYFLGSAIKGIYVSNAYALDELKKNSKRLKFDTFDMKLSANQSFSSFTKKLHNDLTKSGKYLESDIKNMLKPTGFVPSSSKNMKTKKVTDIITEKIYTDAIAYLKKTGIEDTLTSSSIGDAKKAFEH